ncbi:MAG TPA: fibronectin type III domain-containing protein, partial [Acidimicrobiales bacterium]|nr:fibronectin type III domain-containing protein [Acidimicrobiales bacterium]
MIDRGGFGPAVRRLTAAGAVGLLVAAVLSALVPTPAEAAPARHTRPIRPVDTRQAQSRQTAATPASVPEAPFIEQTVPEGLAVLVNWAPNQTSDDVSSYMLTAAVATGFVGKVSKRCVETKPVSAPGTDSSALVSGLCGGIPYVVTMTANNDAGEGAPSVPSNPTVPLVVQPPSPPLITSVLSRSGRLIVNWSAPAIGGGDRLKSYVLTVSSGSTSVSTTTAMAKATGLTLTKLTNGTTYDLSLVAVSKAGDSDPGTSTGTPESSTVPEAPQSLEVVPDGSGDLVATWTAPADPGSSSISGYVVTTQAETESGGVWSPSGSPSTTILGATATTTTLSGLGSTSFYVVSVAATSTGGTGPAATTTNPVTPAVELASSTVVLTQPTMDALGSDSGGTLFWPAPAPSQVSSISSGDVILGPTSPSAPDGLIATVTGISDSSGTYTVTTTAASLADAFSDVSFGYSGDPLAQPGTTFEARSAGVRSLPRNGGVKVSVGRTFAVEQDFGPVKVSGQLALDAEVNLSVEVHTQDLMPDGVSMSASAEATAHAGLDARLSGSAKWQLGQIVGLPIDVQAGSVPIILVPTIPVFLEASGQISVGLSASMTVGAAVSWSSENPGTLDTTNLTTGPRMDGSGPLPGVSATATGTLELSAQPQIGIFGLAGPNVEADADLTATVDFLGSPYFTLAPSVTLKAGLDFDILDGLFHGSLEVTIGTFDLPAFVIESAPKADVTVSPAEPTVFPGTPTTFNATLSSGAIPHIIWSLQGAANGDSITAGGVLTTVEPSGRTLTVVAEDSSGAMGQTTVTVGTPFDPVEGLLASQAPTSLDGDVSWQPPDATGGHPIAHYTVTVSGGVPIQTTTGTSVTLTDLHPGINYVITVYPTNTAGQTGPAASTSLQVILPCTDSFTGGSQGNGTDWNTAANWSGDYVPGPGDWVCVDGPSPTLSTSTTVEGLLQSGVISISSGDDLTVSNTYNDTGTLTGGG